MGEKSQLDPKLRPYREEIVNALMAGESSAKLAKKYGVSSGKLNTWRYRLAKTQQKRTAEAIKSFGEPANAHDAASKQTRLIVPSLVEQRHEISGVYKRTTKGLARAIEQLSEMLDSGKITIRTLIKDEGHIEREFNLTPGDIKDLVSALSQATKDFAALHLLPYGSQSPSVQTPKEGPNAVHQHVHMHGGQTPAKTKKKKDIRGLDAPIDVQAIEIPKAVDVELVDDL